MKDLSRRDLLRASAAGAAVAAVPMSVLAGTPASAATRDADDTGTTDRESTGNAPVMFCVHDAERGEVSILHGESEVIVSDRRLVAQIMKAASVRQDR